MYPSVTACCKALNIPLVSFYNFRAQMIARPIPEQLDAYLRTQSLPSAIPPAYNHIEGPVVYGGREYDNLEAFADAYNLPFGALRAYARKRQSLLFEQVVLAFYLSRDTARWGRLVDDVLVYRGVGYVGIKEFCSRAHWTYKTFAQYRYDPSRVHLSFAEVVDQYVSEGSPLYFDKE